MLNKIMKQYFNEKYTPSIFILMLIAFFIYMMFSLTIGAPIFGSDEYAYFIHGKYIQNIEELYKLDPNLQHVPNLLFFQLINIWVKFTGSEFIYAFRMFHILEYILTAFILHNIFIKFIDRSSAFFGTLVFLLLPITIYNYAVMPETDLVLISVCLGYVLIVFFPRHNYVASVLVGIIFSVSILIKPHSVAIIAASLVFLSAAPYFGLVKGGAGTAYRSILTMLVSFYIFLIILLRLTSHEWVFDPTIALGLSAYGHYIQMNLPTVDIASKVISAIQYSIAHITVLTLVFAPVFVWTAHTVLKVIRKSYEEQEYVDSGLRLAAFYVLAMLITHIAMTAWFTAGTGAISEGESMRLHGRYLGPAIVFLPFLYFYAIKNLTIQDKETVNILILVALFSCALYFFKEFKIFPWDNPILFAFFKAPNHYGFDFEDSYGFLGPLLLYGMMLVWLLVIYFKKMQYRVLFVQIFIIMLFGIIQTYSWVYSHSKANKILIDNSRAISTILGENQFGKGVFVSDNRYGSASFVLFSMENSPKVLIKQPKSIVSANDVKGASWVLFGNKYKPEFDYLHSITIGSFRLFPLTSKVSIEQQTKAIIQPNKEIRLILGADNYAKARLTGFNEQEPWGAWTDDSKAMIEMPFLVQGTLKLKIFGWTLVENLGKPLSIKIGDTISKISLTDSGKEYEIVMNVNQPTDRIFIESPVFQPSNSQRVLGVGISRIIIERQQ